MARVEKKRKTVTAPATPLEALMREHLRSLEVRNYSEYTVKNRRVHIGFFLGWCNDRGLTEPVEVIVWVPPIMSNVLPEARMNAPLCVAVPPYSPSVRVPLLTLTVPLLFKGG